MKEKKFCKNCEFLLPVNLLGQIKGYEFKEGMYCEKCARAKLEKVRK